jgi:hypothetical protein
VVVVSVTVFTFVAPHPTPSVITNTPMRRAGRRVKSDIALAPCRKHAISEPEPPEPRGLGG